MDDDDEWDDDRDPNLDECDHDHATFDILTGKLSCHCGWCRYLSGEEFQRYASAECEAMESYYRECEQTEQDAMRST